MRSEEGKGEEVTIYNISEEFVNFKLQNGLAWTIWKSADADPIRGTKKRI